MKLVAAGDYCGHQIIFPAIDDRIDRLIYFNQDSVHHFYSRNIMEKQKYGVVNNYRCTDCMGYEGR